MPIYDYTVYPLDSIHKAQCGEIMASTSKEAESRIKAIYNFQVNIRLSILIPDYEIPTSAGKK
jgi:hypothetical protein